MTELKVEKHLSYILFHDLCVYLRASFSSTKLNG